MLIVGILHVLLHILLIFSSYVIHSPLGIVMVMANISAQQTCNERTCTHNHQASNALHLLRCRMQVHGQDRNAHGYSRRIYMMSCVYRDRGRNHVHVHRHGCAGHGHIRRVWPSLRVAFPRAAAPAMASRNASCISPMSSRLQPCCGVVP